MKTTIVDKLHQEFTEIIVLIDESEISLGLTAQENFRKSLVIAAASHFESNITNTLKALVRNYTSGNSLLEEFFQNKAIARQYHSLFQWESSNANSFFGLFGNGFKSYMKEQVKSDANLEQAIRAFLEIGNERNRLVHQNFGVYALEKSVEEIYELYQKARPFVEGLEGFMNRYLENSSLAESLENDQP